MKTRLWFTDAIASTNEIYFLWVLFLYISITFKSVWCKWKKQAIYFRSKKCVPEAGIRGTSSNYILQILWDVITWSCPWYLLLAHKSSFRWYPAKRALPAMRKHEQIGPFGRIPLIWAWTPSWQLSMTANSQSVRTLLLTVCQFGWLLTFMVAPCTQRVRVTMWVTLWRRYYTEVSCHPCSWKLRFNLCAATYNAVDVSLFDSLSVSWE